MLKVRGCFNSTSHLSSDVQLMSTLLIQTHGYNICEKTIGIICTAACVIIFIYHNIIKYKRGKSTNNDLNLKETTKKAKILNILLECCIISAMILNIVMCIGHFSVKTSKGTIHASCYMILMMSVTLYAINKCSISYSYFLRLDVAFGNSALAVNKYLLYALYTLTTLYFLSYIAALPTHDKTIYSWNYKYNICESEASNFDENQIVGWIMGSIIILFEFGVSILTLILFIRPLFQLNKFQNDQELNNLIIRVGLLNSIMIISSVISVTLYSFTSSTVLLFIDNFVNSLCLILMLNIHERLFRKICGCCMSCGCCQYMDRMGNMHELQLGAVNSNTPVTPITPL